MNQKRTQNSEQPKSKPSFLSTEQQTSRVQKILENAKKYEGKKDYMMEGIKNIKKKPQSNSQQKRTDIYYQQQQYKNRRTSRQSQNSNKRSETSSKGPEIPKPINNNNRMGINSQHNQMLKRQTSEGLLHQNLKQKQGFLKSLDKKQRELSKKEFSTQPWIKQEVMTGKEIRSMQMNSKLEEVNEERIIKKESTNVRRSDGLVEESERYRSETKLKDIIKENERQKLELKEKYFECMSQKNILNQKNKNYEKQINSLRSENKQLQLIQADLIMENKTKNRQIDFDVKNKKNDAIISQLVEKCNYLSSEIRKRQIQYSSVERKVKDYEVLVRDKQQQISYYQDKIQRKQKQHMYRKQDRGEDLQKLRNYENKIQTIEKQLKNKRQIEEEWKAMKKQKVKSIQLEGEIAKYEKQLKNKNNKINELETQLKELQRIINQLRSSGNKKDNYVQVTSLQTQLKEVYKQKNSIVSQYQQKLLRQNQQMEKLYYQLNQKQQRQLQAQSPATFQEVIGCQNKQINSLREINSEKIGEVYEFKIQVEKAKAEVMNLTNQNKVLSAKLSSLQKNKNRQNEAQLKVLSQQGQTLKRKIETLEQTLETKKKQIREKDLFIQNNMSRMANKEDLPILLAQLQKILNK